MRKVNTILVVFVVVVAGSLFGLKNKTS